MASKTTESSTPEPAPVVDTESSTPEPAPVVDVAPAGDVVPKPGQAVAVDKPMIQRIRDDWAQYITVRAVTIDGALAAQPNSPWPGSHPQSDALWREGVLAKIEVGEDGFRTAVMWADTEEGKAAVAAQAEAEARLAAQIEAARGGV